MLCPDCSYDNIEGVDTCEACGQSLSQAFSLGTDLEESISRHAIEVLLPKPPLVVQSSDSVRAAVAIMVENKVGCVLVEEEGELVGVFTERDVLNKVTVDLKLLDNPVADFMTAAPETITRQDSIAYALHAMDLGGYRHMPIVNAERRPTGIISVRDIMRFLGVRFAQIRS